MKTAMLLVLLTISAFAQQPTLNLTFSPESEKYEQATADYQVIWTTDSKKIIEAMESVSGLRFTEKDVRVIVYEGVSWSGYRADPMKLRASYPSEIKKATLVHELGHRLIDPIRIPKAKQLDEHRVLFLILYDIWEKLYGREFADHAVAVEKKRKGIYDYESAWQWALSLTKEERAAQFKELRDFTEKEATRMSQTNPNSNATESRLKADSTTLYIREIGNGQPVIVLHGGPDFDHSYLLPDLDRLKDSFRLIYYDQRGRGRSADKVRPEDVSLMSDLDDLDRVRQHFRLDSVVLLGHSWGAVLALEYALRRPTRVSHLILMNPAPISAADLTAFRKTYLEKIGADMDRQRAIVASAAYQAGDPEAVTARYRIHFKPALARPEDYEKLMATMQAAFKSQGGEGIVKARKVEDRLMLDTWQIPGYDLRPKLRGLRIPTLVIAGDKDFFPLEVAAHIADALPDSTLVTTKDCGHFAFLECPGEVRKALRDFFKLRVSK
jgi:proline iminopeptidase